MAMSRDVTLKVSKRWVSKGNINISTYPYLWEIQYTFVHSATWMLWDARSQLSKLSSWLLPMSLGFTPLTGDKVGERIVIQCNCKL